MDELWRGVTHSKVHLRAMERLVEEWQREEDKKKDCFSRQRKTVGQCAAELWCTMQNRRYGFSGPKSATDFPQVMGSMIAAEGPSLRCVRHIDSLNWAFIWHLLQIAYCSRATAPFHRVECGQSAFVHCHAHFSEIAEKVAHLLHENP